ncbi:hypothetical protein [Roseitranquillus sediminis]|uniref:hypothetical protein n=1 Tax=Roseitranquillus sediminis TaxID=2809051 RepID=UPI001D0C9337|nr:hypothetical protein [Roseitranquillus sediminis]MBM9593113.1 hypothetical protein [Roseitranquillus sediminis]
MHWLQDLFARAADGTPVLKPGDMRVRGPSPRGRNDLPTVSERLDLIARGLSDLDPDVIVVMEGPSDTEKLQLLMNTVSGGVWECHVQRSRFPSSPGGPTLDSSQCVGIAVRTDTGRLATVPLVPFEVESPAIGDLHEATEPFFLDFGREQITEWFRFERRPLYVEVRPNVGAPIRLLGLHLKSKGIFGAIEWSRWWQIAEAHRARLLALCRHLRRRFIDMYLAHAATRDIPLIVCGGINEGPGFGLAEMQLRNSGVQEMMGSIWRPDLILGNALFDALQGDSAPTFEDLWTVEFPDPIFEETRHRVWTDHLLYSRNVRSDWISDARILRSTCQGTPFSEISDHCPVRALIDTTGWDEPRD